jgi:periplasmic divalent cation tolerance protein
MGEHVLLMTTAPAADKAAAIARTLVDEGLVACVNIVPGVRSIYRWQGETCDDAEVLCLMKTRRDRVETARARIVALHPYQLPEVIAIEITSGHAPYLAWIDEVTKAP